MFASSVPITYQTISLPELLIMNKALATYWTVEIQEICGILKTID